MAEQTTVPTFTAQIWVGLSERNASRRHFISEAYQVCADYANANPGMPGGCVSITPTTFVYVGGSEPGCVVGLINYPRFPSGPAAIRQHALELAEKLRVALGQSRVSVVFPDETVMLVEAP